jgi:hypothetical protein
MKQPGLFAVNSTVPTSQSGMNDFLAGPPRILQQEALFSRDDATVRLAVSFQQRLGNRKHLRDVILPGEIA